MEHCCNYGKITSFIIICLIGEKFHGFNFGMYLSSSEELKAGLSENNNVPEKKGHIEQDGPPDDIRGFFGHPLAAATTSVNGEDTQASAAALLHEYINLPALDKSGLKIGEKLHLLQELIRLVSSYLKKSNRHYCSITPPIKLTATI